ncbi:MAG: hypothetical protein J0M08_07745 [Bacteroidetes bacterium]|nr:hypothetical protein [Bacteroidota bacterium]
MTLRNIYEVKNNQLIINLPDSFRNKKKLLVTVDDSVDTKTQKLELLKKAVNDSLFLDDIKSVNDDFQSIEDCE